MADSADPIMASPETIAAAEAEQRRLAGRVETGPARALPATVTGVDVSYPTNDGSAVGVAVTIDTSTFETLETGIAVGLSAFPYHPGLLSFRELPLVLAALDQLSRPPELIVADGHGYAHPARLGLASHLGIVTTTPTIGCAKTMFVGNHDPVGDDRGSWSAIIDENETVGAALRTRTGVKPVYVSVGHRIDLPSARRIILALSRYRLPETTRRSDHLSRQVLADLQASSTCPPRPGADSGSG